MSTTCDQCGVENPADIHTCTPKRPPNCGTGHCSCVECVMEPPAAPVQDAEGENMAVRSFLMVYGQRGLTVGQMKKHVGMSGFKSWPAWVDTEPEGAHLTKAGAQLWIRHLFALEASQPAAQPAPCTWTKSADPHMPDTFDATCGVVWTFTDGGPVENGVRFCPGCGAKVIGPWPGPEEDLYDLAVKADNGGQP
jgi:hypothetical protein